MSENSVSLPKRLVRTRDWPKITREFCHGLQNMNSL